ncbi:hypothetical protein O181_080522 [Austropuccinia psidii MF-1]|uniref:Uncharacterized protein n=1 Tax=Austropuccinia psidii MF-1 TaxID=1389203 RepID=A0A9Q3IHI4_9BASI|nr:hypothetical protein [Austropuccinia psidii MF-1]
MEQPRLNAHVYFGPYRRYMTIWRVRSLKFPQTALHLILKSFLNRKTTNRHILRWQIAIQVYRGNLTIILNEGRSHNNADGLRRCPLDNVKSNTDYQPEVAEKSPIHFMEIDRKKNFRLSEWGPGSHTPDTNNSGPEGIETPILRISSSKIHNEFFNSVF